jgi:hypothetical protein
VRLRERNGREQVISVDLGTHAELLARVVNSRVVKEPEATWDCRFRVKAST